MRTIRLFTVALFAATLTSATRGATVAEDSTITVVVDVPESVSSLRHHCGTCDNWTGAQCAAQQTPSPCHRYIIFSHSQSEDMKDRGEDSHVSYDGGGTWWGEGSCTSNHNQDCPASLALGDLADAYDRGDIKAFYQSLQASSDARLEYNPNRHALQVLAPSCSASELEVVGHFPLRGKLGRDWNVVAAAVAAARDQ